MSGSVFQPSINIEYWKEHTPTPLARGLEGSDILAIAAEVRALKAKGVDICNLTIGDFDPSIFPIPSVLKEGIQEALDDGQTNYPPAIGTNELRDAIRHFYRVRLGLDYPPGSVLVGAGARPPIYAAFRTIVEPGDVVVYPVPTWNIRFYVYMTQGQGVPLTTKPEHGFMPTASDLEPHLKTARLLVLNSPLNPCGTTIDKTLLQEICEAIVLENRRRESAKERPLMLLYDQVYWQLTHGEAVHHTPVSLVPEMASCTIMVDAISKGWAGTGLRLGWCVCPPWLRDQMKPLIGHMGAWAGRAEQIATAKLLMNPEKVDPFMDTFRLHIQNRLNRLQDGIAAMEREGLPIRCLAAQGGIYLSVQLDLMGKKQPNGDVFDSDEGIRSYLLHSARIAVVPFTAFGYPPNTGWIRLSIGAVQEDHLDGALERLRSSLQLVTA